MIYELDPWQWVHLQLYNVLVAEIGLKAIKCFEIT